MRGKYMKIVYNTCFGGFGLSRKAILRARELSGDSKWGGACLAGDVINEDGKTLDHDYGHCSDLKRNDSSLVTVVEELGEEASGPFAKLEIRDIPSGMKYRIDEYDGSESVMMIDDYDWEIAE